MRPRYAAQHDMRFASQQTMGEPFASKKGEQAHRAAAASNDWDCARNDQVQRRYAIIATQPKRCGSTLNRLIR
jgi:hypothetical protein